MLEAPTASTSPVHGSLVLGGKRLEVPLKMLHEVLDRSDFFLFFHPRRHLRLRRGHPTSDTSVVSAEA